MSFRRYIAKVADNQDFVNHPDGQMLGRIRVICPDFVGGKEDTVLDEWVDPVLDWGWFYIPDIDEMVEIEIMVASGEDRVPFETAILAPVMRWRGTRYWGGEKTDSPRPIPDDFKTNYGKRRGFATPGGHVLVFDDTPGKSSVRITWHDKEAGEDKYSFIALDEKGSVVLSNKAGTTVFLDAENKGFTIVDENGNTFATDSNGSKLIDKFGNIIQMKDGVVDVVSQGGVNVTAANNVTVSCDKVEIKAAHGIKLGSGLPAPLENAALRGDDLAAWLQSHVHKDGQGLTCTPPDISVPFPLTALSTLVKLQ